MQRLSTKNSFQSPTLTKGSTWQRLAVSTAFAVLLSSTFIFLAALPLRYQRLVFGRNIFIGVGLAITAALASFQQWSWAVVYFGLSLLIGSFREFEEKGAGLFTSSLMAIFTTLGAGYMALKLWAETQSSSVSQMLEGQLSPFVSQLTEMPQFKNSLTLESLIFYLPSGMIISMMLVIFVSLTISGERKRPQPLNRFKAFVLPDWMIWIFIGSLGATFALPQLPELSIIGGNVLSVTLAAYFFQGLAVFTCFLDSLKIYGFWRMLAYFLVFFQLFIFVSGLGILDYWFDFREQLKNKLTSTHI
ncbi:MAG: DUF2232 domain-containing protein [Bdellovibrionales bacterium]|nr:DUF2232 domain-containing protein [Bdellovibrionales bacterium]